MVRQHGGLQAAYRTVSGELNNIRSRLKRHELFRTPDYAYKPLLDYSNWFDRGPVLDPAAGDGRMIAEIVRRGNDADHCLIDVREEEKDAWRDDPLLYWSDKRIGSFVEKEEEKIAALEISGRYSAALTNPPFTLAQPFVQRLTQLVDGKVAILQSVAWIGTQKRSRWLKEESHLEMVLQLARRPKWEGDSGIKLPSNIWDFAWYIFDREFVGRPTINWLL